MKIRNKLGDYTPNPVTIDNDGNLVRKGKVVAFHRPQSMKEGSQSFYTPRGTTSPFDTLLERMADA